MGVSISLVVASFIAGAAAAKLLHDSAPILAWLVAAGLCGGLFGLARLSTRGAPTRLGSWGLLALGNLMFCYLLILGGESIPRPATRDALGFITLVVILLGIVVAAVALPVLLIVAALRRQRGLDCPQGGLGTGPLLIASVPAVATFVLGLLLLAVTIWASPPQWRPAAMLALVLGSPALLLPFGASMYQRLLLRWEIEPPPSLSKGLEMLRERTEFVFARVLCLDASFGGGAVCQVVPHPRRSTLVISEAVPRGLTVEPLVALLAHEAAHLRLGHMWRKVAWGELGAVVAITTAVLAQVLIAPWVPRSLGVVGVLVVILPITILRGLYDTYVIRRHEADADAFAVHVAGASALLTALETLRPSGQLPGMVHNRWTTHSTWELRAARIRECEESLASRRYSRNPA